jgi:probable rRNA maturation factor
MPRRAAAKVQVLVEHARGRGPAQVLARSARLFLRQLRVRAELSIAVTTDRRIHTLNRKFRSVDHPTDVLSFHGDGVTLLGDVVISLDTARREAKARRIPLNDELRRYLAHGILHLLGHDHHRRGDAVKMAEAEKRLLGAWGMVGPRG